MESKVSIFEKKVKRFQSTSMKSIIKKPKKLHIRSSGIGAVNSDYLFATS